MSDLERLGTVIMGGKSARLAVRSTSTLVTVCVDNIHAVDMTVAEAKVWREGLSRAIRQAEASEAHK